MTYCMLCGNEKTDAPDSIGTACRTLLGASLAQPWAFWQECRTRNTLCCGRIATEKDHIYFHGKHWECSYPPVPALSDKEAMKEWEGQSVSVEMGVSFYPEGAMTYYIRDFDSYCDSEEYGEMIPYPANVQDEAFWKTLSDQLDKAAEFAWNADLLTCEKCGYHYCASNGPCGCEDDDENTEEAETTTIAE